MKTLLKPGSRYPKITENSVKLSADCRSFMTNEFPASDMNSKSRRQKRLRMVNLGDGDKPSGSGFGSLINSRIRSSVRVTMSFRQLTFGHDGVTFLSRGKSYPAASPER